jgi:hypothetical protein
MLVMGLHPLDLGKNRQRDIHGLNLQIDPHHFFGLQGGIGFDAHTQGTDIQDLADFENGDFFSGKKPVALQLNGLFKGLTGGQALFIFGMHGISSLVNHRKGAMGAKKKLFSFFRGA